MKPSLLTLVALTIALAVPAPVAPEPVAKAPGNCTGAAFNYSHIGDPIEPQLVKGGAPPVGSSASTRISDPYEQAFYFLQSQNPTEDLYDYSFSGHTTRFQCGVLGTSAQDCVPSTTNCTGDTRLSIAGNIDTVVFTNCDGAALAEAASATDVGGDVGSYFDPVGPYPGLGDYGLEVYTGCSVPSSVPPLTDVSVLIGYVFVAPKDPAWRQFGVPSYLIKDFLVTNAALATELQATHAEHFHNLASPDLPLSDHFHWRFEQHGVPNPIVYDIEFNASEQTGEPSFRWTFNRHHYAASAGTAGQVLDTRREVHHEDRFHTTGQVGDARIGVTGNSDWQAARVDANRASPRGERILDLNWTYAKDFGI